jgi:hypothetical protein
MSGDEQVDCDYCGCRTDKLELDHYGDGRSEQPELLQLLCHKCHTEKTTQRLHQVLLEEKHKVPFEKFKEEFDSVVNSTECTRICYEIEWATKASEILSERRTIKKMSPNKSVRCVRCDKELTGEYASLYCNNYCEKYASKVRYAKRKMVDGTDVINPDIANQLLTDVIFLYKGGYEKSKNTKNLKRDLTEQRKTI